MTVEEACAARIAGLAAVIALVGDRVYTDVLPEAATFPCVLVKLVDDLTGQHLRGPDGHPIARVQVDALVREASGVDAYTQVVTLADAIHGDGLGTAASGLFGWIGGVGSPPLEIQSVTGGTRTPRYDPEELRVLTMSRDYLVRYVG